jgi:hypothetical protein
MYKLEKAVVVIFLVGIVLILAGQSLYRYADQTISNLEAKLSPNSLSQNQYWGIEGSLKWWRNALVSTYGPISLYLEAAGIVVLAIPCAYCVLEPLRSTKKEIAENIILQVIDQTAESPEQMLINIEETDSSSE